MKSGETQSSAQEKVEASRKLLEQLRKKLYADDSSRARRAAFNLSWMQEDGLDILSKALCGEATSTTKSAAAYGLRKMNGRMKKMALEVFKQGLKHRNSQTREVCKRALSQLTGKGGGKATPRGARGAGKFNIREIPGKSRQKSNIRKRGGRQDILTSNRFSKR